MFTNTWTFVIGFLGTLLAYLVRGEIKAVLSFLSEAMVKASINKNFVGLPEELKEEQLKEYLGELDSFNKHGFVLGKLKMALDICFKGAKDVAKLERVKVVKRKETLQRLERRLEQDAKDAWVAADRLRGTQKVYINSLFTRDDFESINGNFNQDFSPMFSPADNSLIIKACRDNLKDALAEIRAFYGEEDFMKININGKYKDGVHYLHAVFRTGLGKPSEDNDF